MRKMSILSFFTQHQTLPYRPGSPGLSIKGKGDSMDYYDREHISAAINYFWGKDTASPHSVNERSAEVMYKAISEAQACSASMDLVPRPSGRKPGISYIVKQIASIGKNIASGNTSTYHSCKAQVSALYKSEITMALKGI